MTKIRTRLFSAALTVAVALTAVFGTAATAGAATFADIKSKAKPYTLTTGNFDEATEGSLTSDPLDNAYLFTLAKESNLVAGINSKAAITEYKLIDSNGNIIFPTQLFPVAGTINNAAVYWDSTQKISVGMPVYTALAPGTYYFTLNKGSDGEPDFAVNIGTVTPKELEELTQNVKLAQAIYAAAQAEQASQTTTPPAQTTTPPAQTTTPPAQTTKPAQPAAFTAGVSTATRVTAKRQSGAINVKWDNITGAKYAVYYVSRSNATGAFSEWTVTAPDTNAFTIPNIVKGSAYYITILPYTDTPSRQYGNFSPYKIVKT